MLSEIIQKKYFNKCMNFLICIHICEKDKRIELINKWQMKSDIFMYNTSYNKKYIKSWFILCFI